MIISRSICVAANGIISCFFCGWAIFHCVCICVCIESFSFLCQRKTNIIWYHLHVGSKVTQMNLFIKQKQTHRSQNQTYGYQGRNVRGIDKLAIKISIYTLLYKIIDKNLPYNPGDSIQHSVITYMGKSSEKEWICTYMCMCVYV